MINVPRRICLSLIGKSHRLEHRLAVGGAIMIVGVVTTQFRIEIMGVKVIVELIAYTLHALGSVPWIEWLLDDHDPQPPSGVAV